MHRYISIRRPTSPPETSSHKDDDDVRILYGKRTSGQSGRRVSDVGIASMFYLLASSIVLVVSVP
jgi:hypothetical protein